MILILATKTTYGWSVTSDVYWMLVHLGLNLFVYVYFFIQTYVTLKISSVFRFQLNLFKSFHIFPTETYAHTLWGKTFSV